MGRPVVAIGMELGPLTVHSGSGEPLRLSILLESVESSEQDSLTVSLANPSDYTAAGMDYPPSARDLQFQLVPLGSGSYQIVITTDRAIEEEVLRLLVSVMGSDSRLVRDYPVFLTSSDSQDSVILSGRIEPTDFSRPQTPVMPGGEMTVEWGDTLSHIVQRMQLPEGIHRFQGYLALLRANPEAFVSQNMNRLRSDVLLDIPSLDEIARVSYTESVNAFSRQLAEFTAYKDSLRPRPTVDPRPISEPLSPDSDIMDSGQSEQMELASPSLTAPAGVDAMPEPEATIKPVDHAAIVIDPATDGQLTISQQMELDSELDEDANKTALDAMEAQLEGLGERVLSETVESESIREQLTSLQESREQAVRLIEVEDENLAAIQDRVRDSQERDMLLGQEEGSGDGTISRQEGMTAAGEPVGLASITSDDTMKSDTAHTQGIESKSQSEPDDPRAQVEEDAGTRDGEESLPDLQAMLDQLADSSASSRSDSVVEQGSSEDLIVSGSDAGQDEQPPTTGSVGSAGEEAASDTSDSDSPQNSPLAWIRNAVSLLPDHGQKIAVALLAFLAALFIWQRRKTRRRLEPGAEEMGTYG